jgi:hypothetical protein
MKIEPPLEVQADGSSAFYAHLIEVGRRALGVVAAASGGYRFFAFESELSFLEGRLFESADSARSAVLAFCRSSVPSTARFDGA